MVIRATTTEAHNMRLGVIQASNFFIGSGYAFGMRRR
jgi:hypothetical protein